MPKWTRPILWFFLAVSGAGFLTALLLHLFAIAGSPASDSRSFFRVVFPGIFVVWLPTILVMNALARDARQRDLWKAALRGCPDWMRYGAYGVMGYAWLIGMVMIVLHRSQSSPDLFFTAAPLAFYGIAFAVLYSALHVTAISRKCVNGHRMPPTATFCEECGQPVEPTADCSISR